MAIHRNTPGNKAQAQQQQGQAQGQQQQQQSAGAQPNFKANAPKGKLGTGAVSERIYRPMKRGRLGEVLADYIKSGATVIESTLSGRGFDFDLLPLDANRHGLHYSAAVFVARNTINGERVVSFYTMILEGSASRPRPMVATIYNQPVEVQLSAMDAWSDDTLTQVMQLLEESFGAARYINAGATVVPAELDASDSDAVGQVLWAAQEATLSVLETEFPEEFEHFSIGEFFDSRTERMVASFTYNGEDGEQVTGLPVRSDITMLLSSSKRHDQANDPSAFQRQSGRELVEVNGFVDLVTVPTPPAQPGYAQPTQVFAPRFVITRVGAIDAPNTPEMFLLGLATSLLIGENYAWASQFSNYGSGDMHDIGVVGLRMRNPMDPSAMLGLIPTNTSTFGQEELFDLIRTACHPKPLVSLDCEDVGPDSWLTGAFLEAAHGNLESAAYLSAAANNLTNGLFSQYWTGNEPLVFSESNKIHLGTYKDGGVLRDLREFDNVAMMNLHHNDIAAVNRWEGTFNDTVTPHEMRMANRLEMLRDVAQNLTLRGTAERVTLNPNFSAALVSAVIQAGLMVDQDGLTQLYGQSVVVGNAQALQYMMQGNVNVGAMVNHGPQMSVHGVRRPMSRW